MYERNLEMNKLTLRKVVDGLFELQKENKSASLLGIGPMSSRLLRASFELGKEMDFPLMYIASRNQVDADELGGGYVCGWNQMRFVSDIRNAAEQVGFDGLYYICRDHGGPWQRDNERNEHLDETEAMRLGKQSYVEDMVAGFDLLHIDPTKDPFVVGKVIPLETVLARTIELVEYCEKERTMRGLPEVGYEVGTEETNGGLTSSETYERFIKLLKQELDKRGLPTPVFIVGQTGTLTRKTENVGTFNLENAKVLAEIARKYHVGLKEHNGDYLSDKIMLSHLPAQVTAVNVAPQYGTEETRAYLVLDALEKELVALGMLTNYTRIRDTLLTKAVESERWRKWMVGEQKSFSIDQIKADEGLCEEILDIAGHYTFNDPVVKKAIEKLFANLNSVGVDGDRYVVDAIKRCLRTHAENLGLRGLTSKLLDK